MKNDRLILMIFITPGIACAKQSLVIVTDPWPPYSMKENNNLQGTDVEISQAVFKKLNIPVKIRALPWKRCLAMVEHKEADAILDVSITDQRKKFLYFPEEPISEGITVFFIKKGRELPFTRLTDLNRYKAGALLGYKYCDEIDQALFTINAVRVTTLEANLRMLMADRIDFVIEVDAVGFYQAKKMGLSDQIDTIPNAKYCRGGNYLAFSKKEAYDQLAERFGAALKVFINTDECRQILKNYGLKMD